MNVTGNDSERLAERFEAERAHLRTVAYRMLGTVDEAEDAVQEAWLRLSHSDPNSLENLRAWLTVVVARVCLDMLRARKARGEVPSDADISERFASQDAGADPEAEASLADSVGLALLVVLDTLTPSERLAFVLHDMFAVSFAEIAPIVGRTPTAARQLASRARRRVQGVDMTHEAKLTRQRKVVEASWLPRAGVTSRHFSQCLTPRWSFEPTARLCRQVQLWRLTVQQPWLSGRSSGHVAPGSQNSHS